MAIARSAVTKQSSWIATSAPASAALWIGSVAALFGIDQCAVGDGEFVNLRAQPLVFVRVGMHVVQLRIKGSHTLEQRLFRRVPREARPHDGRSIRPTFDCQRGFRW